MTETMLAAAADTVAGRDFDHYFCQECYPDAERSVCGLERPEDVPVAEGGTATCIVCLETEVCPRCGE